MSATMTVWERLAEPFPEKAVKAYPQTIYKPNGGGKATAADRGKLPTGSAAKCLEYIDARMVMGRLDEVVGQSGWRDEYRVLSQSPWVVECTLTLHMSDVEVKHSDVGYSNDPGSSGESEPAKAAYSDSLKRAAVKFGVGRYLYSRPDLGYIEVDKWGQFLVGSMLAAKVRAKLLTQEEMEAIIDGTDSAPEPLVEEADTTPPADPPADPKPRPISPSRLKELRELRVKLGVDDEKYAEQLAHFDVGNDEDLTDEDAKTLIKAYKGRTAGAAK